MRYLVVGLMLGLVGCAEAPIGANPATLLGDSLLLRDARAMKKNLEGGVVIGALKPDDPVLGCVNELLLQVEAKGPSFVPELTGMLSLGAAAYVEAELLKQAKDGPGLAECDRLNGVILRRGLKAAAQKFVP